MRTAFRRAESCRSATTSLAPKPGRRGLRRTLPSRSLPARIRTAPCPSWQERVDEQEATMRMTIARWACSCGLAMLLIGGPTIQTQGIVGLRRFQFPGEVVPRQATIVARRRSNPLFGFGLVDAVPDESFHATAVFQEYFSPETAGRPNWVRSRA